MKRTARVMAALVVAAVVFFSVGYVREGQWLPVLFYSILGGSWLLSRRSEKQVGDFLFTGFILAGILVGRSGASTFWLISGTVAVLSAWDLDHFMKRMKSVPRVDDLLSLETNHLTRLIIVNVAGWLLASASTLGNINIQFGWFFLLALLAVFVFNQMVIIFKNPH